MESEENDLDKFIKAAKKNDQEKLLRKNSKIDAVEPGNYRI